MSGLLKRRGNTIIRAANEPLRVRYLAVPGYLHHKETLHTDRNTLRGRVVEMRTTSQGISDKESQRLSIEAIILDSANERTKEFILRRIRDANSPIHSTSRKTHRLDLHNSRLLVLWLRNWYSSDQGLCRAGSKGAYHDQSPTVSGS